jgi:hypothetical protein
MPSIEIYHGEATLILPPEVRRSNIRLTVRLRIHRETGVSGMLSWTGTGWVRSEDQTVPQTLHAVTGRRGGLILRLEKSTPVEESTIRVSEVTNGVGVAEIEIIGLGSPPFFAGAE